MARYLLSLFIVTVFSSYCFSQNLLTNGNFEAGAGIGFQSDYFLVTPPVGGQANSTPREYAIINNSILLNTNFFVNSFDNTSGTGLMMVCDGATQVERFWLTNGDVLLQGGQSYVFQYYTRSVNTTNPQAVHGFRVMQGGTNTFNATYNLLPPVDGWQLVSHTFTVAGVGNQFRRLELYNVNTSAVGNDFAIDDLVLFRLTPLQINYSTINESCVGADDASIAIYGVGGTPPYVNYSISGPVNQNNTNGIFTSLLPGIYSISVTDSVGGTVSIDNVEILPAEPLTVTPDQTICSGSSVTLTATNGENYTWSANPADPSLTSPNVASITVTPTQTTTYTVSSTQTSPRNLIFNGDFQQGNVGFLTDYQFLNVTTPTGVQGTYGIVTNPQAWFAPFAPCVDHTTGAGNMMVVDGSTTNAGNNRLWCQTVPVTPGQNYTFSYWVQSVINENFANLEVLINGVSIGINTASAGTCNWAQRTYNWNSGVSTTAEICIYNRLTLSNGNDFAIDDISFTGSVVCDETASTTVTVFTTSSVDAPSNVTSCLPYELPDLTLGNYFTGPGGTGTPLNAGDEITTTSTIYVYAESGTSPNCFAENTFTVTINALPTAAFSSGDTITCPFTSTSISITGTPNAIIVISSSGGQ
ncbi:MAG: hypothetical protein ACK4RM_10180, partial [Flavobacterium sp.]